MEKIIGISVVKQVSTQDNIKRECRCATFPLLLRAVSGTRTRDLRITNAALYQLSYNG